MGSSKCKTMDLTRLSRTISHALRHEPWIYELELDDEGWVPLETLLSALGAQRREWRQLGEEQVVAMMDAATKQRFQLRDGRIRALYGHSTARRLRKTPAQPPLQLFHGTSPRNAEIIRRQGLKPMGRQYVHLSVDRETAMAVGRRKARHPVILQVAALDAHSAGCAFYEGNEQVWLADAVPARYLR